MELKWHCCCNKVLTWKNSPICFGREQPLNNDSDGQCDAMKRKRNPINDAVSVQLLHTDVTISWASNFVGFRYEMTDSLYVLSKELKAHNKQSSCKLCNREDSNNVKVLNCLHQFCEACLKKFLVERSVICPQCGKSMQLGDHGINGLPSHVFYDQVKDIRSCDQWIQQRRDAFCWAMWPTTCT